MTSRTTSDRSDPARPGALALLGILAAIGCGGGSQGEAAGDGGLDAGDATSDGIVDAPSPRDGSHDGAKPDGSMDASMSDDAGGDGSPDGAVNQVPPYDVHQGDRLGCTFGPGSLTTDTVGPTVPHGDALPFAHVVVLMMENHSFDEYMSGLPAMGVTDVDVADDSYSNPDPGPPLTTVHRFHETRYCIADTTHDWGPVHLQYDDGLMDGFDVTNAPGGARAMGYYDQTDIPYYYWMASTFSTSDRYFSSLLGPTWPNRFFFYGATSWGRTSTPDTPPLNENKILNELDTAGRTWQIYSEGTTSFAIVFGPMYAGTSMTQFFTDVANDALPDVAILDPTFSGSGEDDEHPPTDMQLGQALSASIVSALMAQPSVWASTVFFQVYDEHGGYYDHVPPPPACVPDGYTPPDYAFDRYGIRVPVMVVSPFVKAGYVSHLVMDHTSIDRFIENRFDLPAMTARDANAWPMLDMFDFESPPFATPPGGAPPATVDQAHSDWCANNPPGTGMP